MSRAGNHSSVEGRADSKPDAVTDKNGQFTLTQLRGDSENLLFIKSHGYGYEYLSDVRAGDSDLIVEMGPERVIRGKIIGDLSRLDRDKDSAPIISLSNV